MSIDVMGICNVTPDSFSDGGRHLDPADARRAVRAMLDHGATIIDIGGESTRPGADTVTVDDELARVLPVIEAVAADVAAAGARLSIDTRHAAVAEQALAAGATILNDVSASLEAVAADAGAVWIAMHMQGDPRTMQDEPHYDDVVGEVEAFLAEALARGRAAGVAECWLDPGVGFGKTFAHNWTLLGSLDRIVALGAPVVVGASRKAFLGAAMAAADRTEGPTPPTDRVEGSVGVATWAALLGASVIRCHDVRDTAHVVTLVGDPRPDSIVLPEVR